MQNFSVPLLKINEKAWRFHNLFVNLPSFSSSAMTEATSPVNSKHMLSPFDPSLLGLNSTLQLPFTLADLCACVEQLLMLRRAENFVGLKASEVETSRKLHGSFVDFAVLAGHRVCPFFSHCNARRIE